MMIRVTNTTDAIVRFRLAGAPGETVVRHEVAPGASCEVPADIVRGGLLAKIAKGLVEAKAEPVTKVELPARSEVLPKRAETPMPFVVPDSTEADTMEIKPKTKKRKG
jgi:hypothetical protein